MSINIPAVAELAIAAVVFMVLDIATGYIAAWSTKTVSSSKMRTGLAHKYTLLALMLVAGIIDFLQDQQAAQLGFDIPLLNMTSIYIIFMELNSILENIVIIFPDLKNSKILGIFVHHDTEDKVEQVTTLPTDTAVERESESSTALPEPQRNVSTIDADTPILNIKAGEPLTGNELSLTSTAGAQ